LNRHTLFLITSPLLAGATAGIGKSIIAFAAVLPARGRPRPARGSKFDRRCTIVRLTRAARPSVAARGTVGTGPAGR